MGVGAGPDGDAQLDWFGTTLTPLAGGHSGETFLVGDDPAEQQVLRIYRRNPERSVVDAALLRLLRGLLPVPTVIDVRPPAGDDPGILVTERLAGVPLNILVLNDLSQVDWRQLGHELGAVLARMSGVPMPHPGLFVGADLTVSQASMPDDLSAWAQRYRDTGRLASWKDSDYAALLDLLDLAADVTEAVQHQDDRTQRNVLVHSDLNTKNLLVDPANWQVTGVLDWEYAHAGSPYADLGNLTRFEREPAFVSSTVETLLARAPALAAEPLDLARASDLWALVELAGRVRTNRVAELATTLLLAQARAGDLQAWPWATPRVDP